MSLYTFRLSQFRIDNTRSPFNDTDWVVFTIKVIGRNLGLSKPMGSISNGHHAVGLEFSQIPVNDVNDQISIEFSIVNAGHNEGAIEARLQSGLESFGSGLAGTSTMTGFPIGAIIGGAIELVNLGLTPLFADCDGIVAQTSEDVLRSDIDNNFPQGTHVFTRNFPFAGTDSPDGCGSNSKYNVTLTIVRTETNTIGLPAAGVVYKILSRASGLVLDVPGSSGAEKTQIQQFHDNGTTAQHWELIPVDGGFFKIRSQVSGLVLDVPNSSHDNSVKIQQFHDNGTAAQHWEFVPVANPGSDLLIPVFSPTAFFGIRSRTSGKFLDVPGSNSDETVKIQQFQGNGTPAQHWQLINV